jgi:tetratricopeptide (TPR) repeat protein
MLSAEYLQRYREQGDVGDVLRAEAAARRALTIQPQRNVAALQALASAQLTLHRFRDALATVREARRDAPRPPSLAMSEASLDLELGDYAAAQSLVAAYGEGNNETTEIVAARLAELTGDLDRARTLLARASRRADAVYGVPNERRAWFHVRLGELAFSAGDAEGALREEGVALDRFPDDVQALTDTARFTAALGRWDDARDAAERAVGLAPSPENLGLLADAQEHLGSAAAAVATRDEIAAVERIGNAQHLADRLLALEYADRGVNLDDAYAIARRELAVRDDVFAEDTLAWTAARSGRWDVAHGAAARATAWNTGDPRIWYHAGVIAEHLGDAPTARAAYEHAIGLNPRFQAGFADDARARLARLRDCRAPYSAGADRAPQLVGDLVLGVAAVRERRDELRDRVAQRFAAHALVAGGDELRHARAAAPVGDDPAPVLQFRVRARDRIGRHVEIARQLPHRGQHAARRKLAALDQRAHLLDDLRVRRRLLIRIDRDERISHRAGYAPDRAQRSRSAALGPRRSRPNCSATDTSNAIVETTSAATCSRESV